MFKGWKSLALAVLVVLPALGRMDPAEAGDGAARVLLVHSYHENPFAGSVPGAAIRKRRDHHTLKPPLYARLGRSR